MKTELICFFSIPFVIVAVISGWKHFNPDPPPAPTPAWVTKMSTRALTPEERAEAEADERKNEEAYEKEGDTRDFSQDNRGYHEE